MNLTGDANLSRLAGLGTGILSGSKTGKALNSIDNAVSSSVKTLNHIDDVADVTKAFDDVVTDGGGKYSAFGEMSEADGIRYRDWNYDKIKEISIKNPDSDSMTLGKYIRNPDGIVSPKSYTEMAKSTGDTYFDLGTQWEEIKEAYNLSDKDMFDLFNTNALDEAVSQGKTIRFSQNPSAYGDCALKDEWTYLKEKYGYTDLIKEGDYWYAYK